MASHDHSRTPMSSRRVRRHAHGVSNTSSHDDNSSISARSTVSLIHADRVYKVAQRERPLDAAARETRVEDRPTIAKAHDKLFKTHGERFVRNMLRSLATDGTGLLSRDQLRAALDRLHVGLDPEERDRIVARVAPEAESRVHYQDFLRSLEAPQPLGGEQQALARGMCLPGPPVVRPGGGGSGVGDGGKSYWNWQRRAQERIPGILDEVREGSPEQAQSDSLLTSLLATKLAQYPDKLRVVFRQMDANRNSVIDREEFARGLAKLRLVVSRAQSDRLFDLVDTDHNGTIDYEEFVSRFEEKGLAQQAMDQAKERLRSVAQSAPPLEQSLGLTHDEVASAVRHPLVLELARSLYGKGSGAAAVFQKQDLPRCGRLDVPAMTACCQALVPGIGERQVAALMVAMEPGTSGHVDYRAFVSRLLEAGGPPPHPRMAHSAPPGGQAGGKGALARFGESPLTQPEPLPTQHTRALSAVALSRRAEATADPSTSFDPSASSTGIPPAISVSASERTGLHDLHDIAIGPVIESLYRAAAAGRTGGATGGGGSASAPVTDSGGVDGAAGGGGGGGGDGGCPVPAVSRSVDVGHVARSQLQLHEALVEGVGAAGKRSGLAAGTGIRAPSHASGRFSRFWGRHYADTTQLTSADPASSLYSSADGAFVRKGQNAEFLDYQDADRQREAKRRQQQAQRFQARSEVDTRYSAQDDASGADEGRLAVARAAHRKYQERCEMYDRLRHQEGGDSALFGRLPAFNEHKSDAANEPSRSYW